MTAAADSATPTWLLRCHPAQQHHGLNWVLSVRLAVQDWPLSSDTALPGLLLHYCLQGPMAALQIPAPLDAPQAADGLWQRTCFELFIGPAGQTAYQEFNFSPSGQWAAYRFLDERVRNAAAEAASPATAPHLRVQQTDRQLSLQAWLPLTALDLAPASNPASGWQVGLSAVLQDRQGNTTHWALHHPQAQPDFHHRSGWTATLPAGPLRTPA